MRKIKFRGLRKDGKGWIYGCLINNAFFNSKTKHSIPYIFNPEECDDDDGWEYFDDDYGYYEVIPETVSMYSSFRDRFGDWIYEGDIVLFLNTSFKYKVVFIDGCFKLIHIGEHKVLGVWGSIRRAFDFGFKLQVIGNIHENGGLI